MRKAQAPFLIIVIWQAVDPNVVISARGFFEKQRWFPNGTSGQGSYYYPLLIQLIFTFPVICFIIKRKGRRGLWIIPSVVWLVRSGLLSFRPLEAVGRASYHIFLVQMVYYRSYRGKMAAVIRYRPCELIAGIVVCTAAGMIFYLAESRMRKAIAGAYAG